MATTLVNSLAKVSRSGQASVQTKRAQSWLGEQLNSVNSPTLLSKGDALTTKIAPGRMYLFAYEAKTENLPYFDKFPLIFPFSMVDGGFYGINLHYLPHLMRAQLMDALMGLAEDDKMNGSKKLALSYSILNSISKSKYVAPCVKHYLNSQVQSRFLLINSNDWQKALFLPLEKFQGATRQQVYKDSRRKIKGR
jgi:hypothetical protein